MAFRLRSRKPTPERVVVSHPDDPKIFERTKRLGIFAVQYLTPQDKLLPYESITQRYQAAGVIDSANERILDLHLRRDVSLKEAGPEAVRSSFGLLAEYVRLQAEHMQPDEIVGITDPVLGRVARRFGFAMHDIDDGRLPQIEMEQIKQNSGRAGRPLEDLSDANFRPNHTLWQEAPDRIGHSVGHLVVVHQTTHDFMERFDVASPDEQLPA